MSFYEKIKNEEGIKFFPFIQSVFISEEEDFWANPFENRDIRARCFFKIINKKEMKIFFHLTEDQFKEMGIKNFPCNTYFSGAYNQVMVCQMRAFGKLHLLSDISDINDFRNGLEVDLNKRTNDTNVSFMYQLTTQEKKEALKIVKRESGKFFKFIPITYASHVYERG